MYDPTKTKGICFLKKLHGKVLWCKLSWDQRMLQGTSGCLWSNLLFKADSAMKSDENTQGHDNWVLKTSKD